MPLVLTGQSKSRKSEKVGQAIKPPKSPEVEYRRSLFRLNRLLKQQTSVISQMVKDGATPASVSQNISDALEQANREYSNASQRITSDVLRQMSDMNKRKIESVLKKSLGVDAARIIDGEDVRDAIQIATGENISLIKSIPNEHFGKVAQAVFQNYRGETFAEGGLSARLRKIGTISDGRAKFIARDQTAKFVSSLNEIRQKEAGISGYIWRNQQDERVVGNPSGLYPKGNAKHGNHWNREGKTFTWDKPPSDGHPGQAINCRCFAEPIIDMSKVEKDAIQL